jgi:hypothetical protein
MMAQGDEWRHFEFVCSVFVFLVSVLFWQRAATRYAITIPSSQLTAMQQA